MAPKASPAPLETEGWRPNDGDILTGTIASVSRAWSDWTQSFYPLVTVRTDDGMTDVHAFHHTLRSRLMEVKPKVGDRIEIVYLGKRPTKDGKREVAIYKVAFPDATGQEAWDMLAAQDSSGARAADQGDVPADTDELPF